MNRDEGMDPASHEETRLVLPWLATGTLSGAEAARVERHLTACQECREELTAEQRLREVVHESAAVAPEPHPVQLARLWERIDVDAPPRSPARPYWRGRTLAGLSNRWRWIVVSQTAAMVVLGALALAPRQDTEASATFRTLAATPGEGSTRRIRVVFVDRLDQRGLRDILLPLGAEIVSGPSPLGVYTISLPADRTGDPLAFVVAHLRAIPEVRFAEPLYESGGS